MNLDGAYYGSVAAAVALMSGTANTRWIGDSYATQTPNLFGRVAWAALATAAHFPLISGERRAFVDAGAKVDGAHGAYNTNGLDRSNFPFLAQLFIHHSAPTGSPGAQGYSNLWAVTEGNAFEGYSDDGGATHDFAHQGLPREGALAFFHVGGVTVGNQHEYCRHVIRQDAMASSLVKINGPTGKVAWRPVWLSPSDGSAVDAEVRRLVDVGSVASNADVTLGDHPTFRYNIASFHRGVTGAQGSSTGIEYGGLFNASILGAHATVNADGDKILTPGTAAAGNIADGNQAVALRDNDAIAAGRFQPHAGGLITPADDSGDRLAGMPGWGAYGVNSASYSNIANATASGKNFTAATFAKLVRHTSHDLDQPLVVCLDYAEEPGTVAAIAATLKAAIEDLADELGDAGFAEVHFVVHTSHMHLELATSESVMRTRIEDNRAAARVVCDELNGTDDDNGKPFSVLNISSYDQLGGVLFNGSGAVAAIEAIAGDASAVSLADGVTADLSSGDLLDTNDLHPEGENAGLFFAQHGFWPAAERAARRGGPRSRSVRAVRAR